ncbi:ATP-binding protein [Pelagicoccus mobilis]|uniref:histidine kinase n=1 Tax=Pelagicoccus mobilis TaxID=415221 RepID=A0A934RYG2_9BACT|nr:ATP-binding protein [Pelagicoccus mobilis]MBK1877559.1 hypothetical protein [Pelagicoccus mobilis]
MNSLKKMTNHSKVMWLCLLSGFPGLIFMLVTFFREDYSMLSISTIVVVVSAVYLFCFVYLYKLVVHPWQVMANVISAFKERDFTLRIKYSNVDDPLELSFLELNSLADCLQNQRMDVIETHELLSKILQEVEAAVFCFDEEENLKMANEFGRELFACEGDAPLSGTASELNLKPFLREALQSSHEIEFPGRKSRWLVKRSIYREGGMPHTMLLVADLQGPLREEELDAWKKLIRVLGHELNNSMTPLRSMADSLKRIVRRDPLPDEWREDVCGGLSVIERRVESLSRFVTGYSQLARLPAPQLEPFFLKDLLERVTTFESRCKVDLEFGPEVELSGDESQLELVITNLLKNAAEALEGRDGVTSVGWDLVDEEAVIRIKDEGHGLAGEDNIFVPFFSTKAQGSGIGLFLSRQIVEAHHGRLTLENRTDRAGCVATIALPVGL